MEVEVEKAGSMRRSTRKALPELSGLEMSSSSTSGHFDVCTTREERVRRDRGMMSERIQMRSSSGLQARQGPSARQALETFGLSPSSKKSEHWARSPKANLALWMKRKPDNGPLNSPLGLGLGKRNGSRREKSNDEVDVQDQSIRWNCETDSPPERIRFDGVAMQRTGSRREKSIDGIDGQDQCSRWNCEMGSSPDRLRLSFAHDGVAIPTNRRSLSFLNRAFSSPRPSLQPDEQTFTLTESVCSASSKATSNEQSVGSTPSVGKENARRIPGSKQATKADRPDKLQSSLHTADVITNATLSDGAQRTRSTAGPGKSDVEWEDDSSQRAVAAGVDRAKERFAMMDLIAESVHSRRLAPRTPRDADDRDKEVPSWSVAADSMRLIWYIDSEPNDSQVNSPRSGVRHRSDTVDSDSRRMILSRTKTLLRRRLDENGGDSSAELARQRLSIGDQRRLSASLSLRGSLLGSSLRQKRPKNFFFVDAAVREPPLKLSSFGERWSLDAFTLFHNAIRIEMKDLFSMLTGIRRCLGCMVPEHIKEFFAWFGVFRELVTKIFELQHAVILPKISAFLPLENDLDEDAILDHHRDVLSYTDKISRFQDDFLVRRSDRAFAKLMISVEDFSGSILHLFAVLESDLPDVVQVVGRQITLENDIRAHIRKWNKPGIFLPIIARSLSEAARAEWIRQNIRGKWKLSWSNWVTHVENSHTLIARKLASLNPDIDIAQ
mmetsp:Transcript_13305/g.27028  ORF Transcript_13305/g.27028 Transcript_13305/m.27028 type:complete len:723 (-) Transcript_13305:1168-3336(-)|eukprot:CAMPEP_0184683292 /NCGR_PEP_ID=MMETSP0312-20130426/10645_1 /TAXON_ID=31354 /ORGANISM="Compsopogon coeruleus, Strain SAG 36.94" /LENGTH=722 /DNA_ID=CAMNT_0027135509 /DNA_START=459 /DNA_END=2630 /DNA_ORIENTATION=-